MCESTGIHRYLINTAQFEPLILSHSCTRSRRLKTTVGTFTVHQSSDKAIISLVPLVLFDCDQFGRIFRFTFSESSFYFTKNQWNLLNTLIGSKLCLNLNVFWVSFAMKQNYILTKFEWLQFGHRSLPDIIQVKPAGEVPHVLSPVVIRSSLLQPNILGAAKHQIKIFLLALVWISKQMHLNYR